MTAIRVLAAAILVLGGVLVWYGHQEEVSMKNQLTNLIVGENTHDTKVLYGSGAAAIAIGAAGLALGGKRR